MTKPKPEVEKEVEKPKDDSIISPTTTRIKE
jgi:hypothetical protein